MGYITKDFKTINQLYKTIIIQPKNWDIRNNVDRSR